MKISACTISFRHALVSFDEIVSWAGDADFDGIELWGWHARSLAQFSDRDAAWLRDQGLALSMLSEYVEFLHKDAECLRSFEKILDQAEFWETPKVRLFAGKTGSATYSRQDRRMLARKLRLLSGAARDRGKQLLLETHPNTFLDNLEATEWLLGEVDHPNLKINFDVLHVWEAGHDPLVALDQLREFVMHMHFKNVRSRELLGNFDPGNVFAPSGRRDGMVPLFEGEFAYEAFLAGCRQRGVPVDCSLEWFGGNVKQILAADAKQLRNCWARQSTCPV